jgi:hypothetical protein
MYDVFVFHVHKFCLYLGANIDFGYFSYIIHMLKVNSVSPFSYDRKHSQTHNGQNINRLLIFIKIYSFWYIFTQHNNKNIRSLHVWVKIMSKVLDWLNDSIAWKLPVPLFRGGGKPENPEKTHQKHALNVYTCRSYFSQMRNIVFWSSSLGSTSFDHSES